MWRRPLNPWLDAAGSKAQFANSLTNCTFLISRLNGSGLRSVPNNPSPNLPLARP